MAATMGDDVRSGLASRAADAVARGDFATADEMLRAEQASRALSPDELEVLAHAAYGAGDLEATLTTWERLHRGLVETGDHVAAARAATMLAMYLMMDTGLMAPVRGWAARAERLLAGSDETPVHAWLAMVRTYERFMCGDMAAARRLACEAIEVGLRHGAAAPVALGRVASARIMILDGHVEDGLTLLDEAAVALVPGELGPLATGMVYCELICAMQGLAQYDRAEQWTEAMEHWRRGRAFGGINGRCRVHRAEILRLRGSCEDAEAEALNACDELRPWMRREFGWPLTELGAIRLRRGDLEGAEEALLAAHEHGWDPQPWLALVRLAQGDVETAVALIGDALEHPRKAPSKEQPPYGALPRAPLLDAQVEIALAAGDLTSARAAADELGDIARIFRSAALTAAAALARARVALAASELETAVEAAAEAMRCWLEVGAPYEASVARMVLAEAYLARGNAARAQLEFQAAEASLGRIGAIGPAWRPREPRRRPGTASGKPVEESAVAVPAVDPTTSVFRSQGDTRHVEFAGRAVTVRDLKGMRYLARLLAEPGREFHALDLVTTERGSLPRPGIVRDAVTPTYGGDLGAALDDVAVDAYRRRLVEVEDDLEEATRSSDLERIALASADRDYLVHELTRTFGLGGRPRPTGSDAERARASVTRAVRYAIRRLGRHHEVLADHLRHTVNTGTYCSYTPDPRAPTDWRI